MKIIAFLLLPLFITITSYSQETVTTKSGKKAVLNADGTWNYVDQKTNNNQTDKIKFSEAPVSESTCDDLILERVDKVTGNKWVASKSAIVVGTKNQFRILLVKLETSLVFSVAVDKISGCIDENAEVNFLFTDGTRFKTSSHSSFNCQGEFVVYMGDIFKHTDLLALLSEKTIETMRIHTRQGFAEQDFPRLDAEDLRKTVNCLK